MGNQVQIERILLQEVATDEGASPGPRSQKGGSLYDHSGFINRQDVSNARGIHTWKAKQGENHGSKAAFPEETRRIASRPPSAGCGSLLEGRHQPLDGWKGSTGRNRIDRPSCSQGRTP